MMVFHFVDHSSQGFAKRPEGDDLLEWINPAPSQKGQALPAGIGAAQRGHAGLIASAESDSPQVEQNSASASCLIDLQPTHRGG